MVGQFKTLVMYDGMFFLRDWVSVDCSLIAAVEGVLDKGASRVRLGLVFV